MHLDLVRYAYLDHCVLGRLKTPEFELCTIERPWIPNGHLGGTPRESCVPDGLYTLISHHSERFPATYALISPEVGVYRNALPEGQQWGRTAILLHQGNTVSDVIGCIAVGMRVGELDGQTAVLSSRVAMDKLRALLDPVEHEWLTIRPTGGTDE